MQDPKAKEFFGTQIPRNEHFHIDKPFIQHKKTVETSDKKSWKEKKE